MEHAVLGVNLQSELVNKGLFFHSSQVVVFHKMLNRRTVKTFNLLKGERCAPPHKVLRTHFTNPVCVTLAQCAIIKTFIYNQSLFIIIPDRSWTYQLWHQQQSCNQFTVNYANIIWLLECKEIHKHVQYIWELQLQFFFSVTNKLVLFYYYLINMIFLS